MASMYRNTNLEEIEVDSFLGIEYLKHQTILQKAIFIGGFVCGGALLFVCTLAFKLNSLVSLLICSPFLLLSIAFGCNYNEDLTLIKYLILLLVEPTKELTSCPTEDIEYIRKKAKEFADEAEVSSDEISEEEHRKTLHRFIFGVVAFVIVLTIMLIMITVLKDDGGLHHTI